MSDHLMKKHVIKDRNQRKNLMNIVRKSCLNEEIDSSSAKQKM